MAEPLPVLWLTGIPGAGKTTVGFEVFAGLARDGVRSGFVDIDQLGMCYPEPAHDPGRYRLKAANLNAVVAGFRAAGARGAVVAGVVHPDDDAVEAALLPDATLTRRRLHVAPEALRERIERRGRPTDEAGESLRYAEALDRTYPADVRIDTTGRSVADLARSVRERMPAWPLRLPEPSMPPPVTGPGEVLLLCGVSAVGKSTVGWEVYQRTEAAAFADLDQLGFLRPPLAADPGGHRLRAANLAAIWRSFRERGARRLVAVGPVDRAESLRHYAAALPEARVVVGRLHAGHDRLTERMLLRGRGQVAAWGLAGDDLIGRPPDALRRLADRASAEAEALDRAAAGDFRVDTDGRPVAEIAGEILRRAGWPDQPGG